MVCFGSTGSGPIPPQRSNARPWTDGVYRFRSLGQSSWRRRPQGLRNGLLALGFRRAMRWRVAVAALLLMAAPAAASLLESASGDLPAHVHYQVDAGTEH